MKRTLLIPLTCFFTSILFGQSTIPSLAQGVDIEFDEKQQEIDMNALRRWLEDKRLTSLKELGSDLSISAEVRTECQCTNEKQKAQGSSTYIKQRGYEAATDKPDLAWDIEFNLMMDYHTDRTWAAVKVEFDNDMGIRSGTVNKVKLEKAYMGGRLIAGDTFTFDADIGRRYLSNAFDSKIEFGAVFDGSLFRLSKAFENIGDFYTNIGIFLVDDKFNHYGEVIEIGALKIGRTGFNTKYSLINWYKPFTQAQLKKNFTAAYLASPAGQQNVPQPWRYLVNQFLVFYQVYPEWLGKRLFKLYAAGLINPMAQRIEQTGKTKQNVAWYAGVSMGLVKKAGDWAIDANYQWAQAQVAPNVDSSGIGLGNAQGQGFFTTNINGSGNPTTQATAAGNFNYQGFSIDALYAFTDNITIQQQLAMTHTLNKHIGPYRKYKQYEIEFIYAF